MNDHVLVDGDLALFQPNFGAAVVTVQPGTLVASGPGTVGGRRICVVGDEASVAVASCAYVAGAYSIPGAGTLRIESLAGDQQAQKTRSGGAPVMLVGGTFTARFQVDVPAQQPPPGPGSPIPDATPQYTGSGAFVSSNQKFRGV